MKRPDITDVFYQNYSDTHNKFHFDYMVKENNWYTDDTFVLAGFRDEMDAKRFCLIEEMIDALIEAHELIEFELKFGDEINMKNILNHKKHKIEQALKKAGVEL